MSDPVNEPFDMGSGWGKVESGNRVWPATGPATFNLESEVGRTILGAVPETGNYYDVRLRMMRDANGGGCVIQYLRVAPVLEPE
jgi:hypothetical protein